MTVNFGGRFWINRRRKKEKRMNVLINEEGELKQIALFEYTDRCVLVASTMSKVLEVL